MAQGTTQYKLRNAEPLPTPADGTFYHFVPDQDSDHFAEFSQDCATYLPLRRWHDEDQAMGEVGVGTIRTDVPILITYSSSLGYYVLGGMPANKDLNEWHETALAEDIGPGSAKYHYRDFGLTQTIDFVSTPRHDAVSQIYNGSSGGVLTVKFGTTLSGVRAINKGVAVTRDMALAPGDLLHMVATEDGMWRIIAHIVNASSGGGLQGPPGVDGGTVYVFTDLDYTVLNDKEVVMVDSSVGPITIYLPAAPIDNHYVGVWDVGDNAANNNITISRAGNTIFNRAEDVVIDMDGGRFDFIYNGDGA